MYMAWQQNVGQLGEVNYWWSMCEKCNGQERCFCWIPGLTGIFFPRSGNHIWDQGLSAINAVASLSRNSHCYFPDEIFSHKIPSAWAVSECCFGSVFPKSNFKHKKWFSVEPLRFWCRKANLLKGRLVLESSLAFPWFLS